MNIIIVRFLQNELKTLGYLLLEKNGGVLFRCYTIESPWKNNSIESCIPPAPTEPEIHYIFQRPETFDFPHLVIKNIRNRENISIIGGHYASETHGNIGVGKDIKYRSDYTYERMLTHGKETINELVSFISPNEEGKLIIYPHLRTDIIFDKVVPDK